jgi:hypothetical protein
MTSQILLITNSILALVVIVFAGFTFYKLRRLERLRNNFMLQGQEVNIEEILSGLALKIRDLERGEVRINEEISKINHELHFVVQKVGTVRFNSLSDQGGNLSFSVALLDKTHTGFVMTSMHGRDQNRIYTKAVIGGQSDIPLTEEEQQAIDQAHSVWDQRIRQ